MRKVLVTLIVLIAVAEAAIIAAFTQRSQIPISAVAVRCR
jgi:hypothetical protein